MITIRVGLAPSMVHYVKCAKGDHHELQLHCKQEARYTVTLRMCILKLSQFSLCGATAPADQNFWQQL